MDAAALGYLGGMVVMLVLSILYAGAATAVGTISRDSIQKMVENKITGASYLYGIMKNRRRFHLMLLAGKIITVVAGVFFLFSFVVSLKISSVQLNGGAQLVALALAVCLFVFSEAIVARFVSIGESEVLVSRFAFFLLASHLLLFPVTFILDWILSLFIEKNQEIAAKEEALLELVKSETEAGVIEREEQEMIEGVLEFSDTTVREVMVPRIDMVAIEKDTPPEEMISLFKAKGHSRIPVYDGRVDNIMGVVYAKDILPVIAEKGMNALSIAGIMRKPYFVHESKLISDLLAEIRKTKVHLAVVVDEYGGTAGIVALEDLLEEIVGDIYDEYDRDERDFLWINDRTVLMDAGLDIDDVNDIIHSDIKDEDFDTLGGFIYHQLGIIPKGGEEFKWENLMFTIKQIDGNRISKVLVQLEEPLLTESDDSDG